MSEISKIVNSQKEFFKSGKTFDIKFRLKQLTALYAAINANKDEIHAALNKDLGKSSDESYMCETGLVLSEISYMLKHLKRLSRPKRVKTPLSQSVSKSYRLPSPYGTALIVSPWNYPVLLALNPLADALAAGNTALIKTSSSSPNTSALLKEILDKTFPREYVALVYGGRANDEIWKEKYDFIFFTGSKKVGKFVYERAAENLTPVVLELGGKSPCIVDKTADIPLAAKRIVWGKFLNLGQTCVAPDYIFCDFKVYDALLSELKKEIKRQFGKALENPNYGKMINEKSFKRVLKLIDGDKVVCGGEYDEKSLKIEPTLLAPVTEDDDVMGEEIFGPVLPVMIYNDEREVFEYICSHDSPLALYVFSSDKKFIKCVTCGLGFGGGCVNDVVVHLATPYLPFGGFGASGMGAYHGKFGFETFTHYKSIVDKKTFLDLPFRYSPKESVLKHFIK